MLLKRKSTSSFDCSGRRVQTSCTDVGLPAKATTPQPPPYLGTIRRVGILRGMPVPDSLSKPFLRHGTKRRRGQQEADRALSQSTLGPKKRRPGANSLGSLIGKPLTVVSALNNPSNNGDGEDDEDDESSVEQDRPFEPLLIWTSPHNGGSAKGLPSQIVSQVQTDEYGIEMTVKTRQPAPLALYSKEDVYVPPILAKWLRPHQREGVQFMYECVMGLKDYGGQGCILADDMGLGKTLQSVTLIYTLLKTGITAKGGPTAKKVIVVCPCSLVKNWENEFVKWLGPNEVKVAALAESDRAKTESTLTSFAKLRIFQILVCSYECIRAHSKKLTKFPDCCDLLVCDEAHRLKNRDNQTSRALNSLPVKRRVLLTGTPMQNDLQEFFAMVDFTNPGVLGTQEEFRRNTLFPILRGREPDATPLQKNKMMKIQEEMSRTVNEFILRRVNTLNAQHLPPKLVQVVCCNLTEIQQNMYQHLISSKDLQHVMEGKQVNCLGSIQMLMKLCNHPSLIADEDPSSGESKGGRRAASKQVKYTDENTEPNHAAPGADGVSKFLPFVGGGRGSNLPVHPEWSGKMFVLYRLMKEMRKPGNGNDKIVIISNYTQTLDLIGKMCKESSWRFCRLDGSINMKKRQAMVDEFNDPSSTLIAFLLSSKAGGCGLNLIGGNRLVLFDPDWNPAVDKQAAARCWRDGQKKRCFTYRFLATGTVEEKIFQRQLSKEGLQSIVDDKEQVNALSTKELRNLFKLRTGTPSDTHDKLRCERCQIIQDDAELEAQKVLPLQLAECHKLLQEMMGQSDSQYFLQPMNPEDHGVNKEAYEKAVRQPMDLSTIQSRLVTKEGQESYYKNISSVSKDVNRIFSNTMKVWGPGDDVADAARRLQSWWIDQWTALVPRLMTMKAVDESKPDMDESDGMEGSATFNNERGEHYQEQIGLPDEENMRSWSHHHTTDTVDDPVFRAAMRGSDAVSFVFGLEVTWSLIQQRQQEEEDRKAMEAIEEVGEEELEALNNMGDDNDVQEGEQPEEAKAVASVDSDEEEMEFDGDDDDDKENVEVVNVDSEGSQEMDSENSEAEAELVLSSDDGTGTVNTAAVESKTQEAEILASSQETDGEVQQMATDTWECATCTLKNDKAHRKCEACGTHRPRKSP
eukprot:Nitzschia sp. Nitz4//scaffold52_size167869//21055//24830//NITZ4_002260-RA/size167869-snap-gene-0.208-mRNA-1//1//CDS//3329553987//638//frame0